MKIYTLERTQHIKADLETIWEFFCNPENLDMLTPPNMGFQILTPSPLPKMHEGQILEYKVRPVLNIPIFWRTEITEVQDMDYFIDEQRKGPYSLWRHKHTFTTNGDEVIMHDRVDYALPLGILGNIAHRIYVKNRLAEIFDYRFKLVDKEFGSKRSDNLIKAIAS